MRYFQIPQARFSFVLVIILCWFSGGWSCGSSFLMSHRCLHALQTFFWGSWPFSSQSGGLREALLGQVFEEENAEMRINPTLIQGVVWSSSSWALPGMEPGSRKGNLWCLPWKNSQNLPFLGSGEVSSTSKGGCVQPYRLRGKKSG